MKRNENLKIKILKNGPYEVTKNIPLNQAIIKTNAEGESKDWQEGKTYQAQEEDYHLCRCGQSKTKPYCDGTHEDIGFKGKETADKEPYEDGAKHYRGKKMDLLDNESLCAGARFCDPEGGVWVLATRSEDPAHEKLAIREACNCPAGRLTIVEKDGTKIEPELPQEISLIQDVFNNYRGPIWVKGGIEIEGADGESYEVRNRVTLCRCGESQNMPFCDASHYNCTHMMGTDS
ncbi:CDGSH iron-sulfur domain-containing protein [Brucepastera parasyntrophica]|uniref:CDGSH iron-sulfur domain-containing protein n=1 Tax=Brucepastera parasyntrophica TaxID=2880008 RepID=UPI00210D2492|nr:CDGSH iron-sulfur domain-containing protein [Brucepastera parasyntrophica]ULQ58584.1 CDGSH iron-sulfur domain-containing protein [Brucepastera parasyntrophica]